VLAVFAVIWGIAALAAGLVAAFGVERLLAMLPPLAVDADAVGGAIVAVSLALAIAAAAHLGVLLALNRGLRVAWTAGLLLSGLGVAVTIGLMGSAFASAAAQPSAAIPLVAAGMGCFVASFGYAGAVAWFIGEIRAGAPSRGGV
jgi:hypothetical protein